LEADLTCATLAQSEIPRLGLGWFPGQVAEAVERSEIPGAIEVKGEASAYEDGRMSASSGEVAAEAPRTVAKRLRISIAADQRRSSVS
jgi:hypothetical protein